MSEKEKPTNNKKIPALKHVIPKQPKPENHLEGFGETKKWSLGTEDKRKPGRGV